MLVPSSAPSKPQPADQQPPPSYGATVQQPVPHPTEHAFYQYVGPTNSRESATKRFFKAFVLAVLIWLLFTALVRSTAEALSGKWPPADNFSIPNSITLQECIQGNWSSSQVSNDHPYHVQSSFDLPISSDTLLLLSRGDRQSGRIEVTTSPNVTDVARVDVTVSYSHADMLNHVKVCHIERSKGENGVGFFTPRRWGGRWWSGSSGLYTEIKLSLPETSDSPLVISSFETDMHNYLHQLIYPQNSVQFGTLALEGSNKPIIAKTLNVLRSASLRTSNSMISIDNLSASTATIRTSNGAVLGAYNASDSLTIRTSNAPIQATVHFYNEQASVANLLLRTSNDIIDSKINLLSSLSSGGHFKVSTRTSNGALKVNVTMPVDTNLVYNAITSNAKADVWLSPAFEGKYALVTSNSRPTLLLDEDVTDPAGRGRHRVVHQTSNKAGFLEGVVYWDEKTKHGHADVRSSNEAVTLHL